MSPAFKHIFQILPPLILITMGPDHHLTPQELKDITNKEAFNLNIGVLGHVDSGKTSLCKVLSQITSTASLDKNPQSQERGITLDLGFSAFFTRVPTSLQKQVSPKKYLQFTLVDCPGHASLLKTVIGGAQIIDLMFLVVDINKGIQTQTVECIGIGELFIEKMIVVVNKVDSLENSEEVLPKKIEALRKIFSKTKYGGDIHIVPFSTKEPQKYSQQLIETLQDSIVIPQRKAEGNFMMLIDHCFPIKGKGSVVTGTVIEGSVKSNDEVEFPLIKESKKVKSLQMFKKPVNQAIQGDRVALLFTQLQSQQIERGLCCTPGFTTRMQNCIITLKKIKYFKLPIKSKAKFHVISGHQMSMANIRLLYTLRDEEPGKNKKFDFQKEYETAESLDDIQDEAKKTEKEATVYGLLSFEKQFYSNLHSLLVGYKFDGDINDNVCRIAFSGSIVESLKDQDLAAGLLKIYRFKSKRGVIDKVVDNHTIIIKDLFKKDVNIQTFIGKMIEIQGRGLKGKILSSFGNSGKVKGYFEQDLLQVEGEVIDEAKLIDDTVVMNYKKYYSLKK